uniref:Metalloendopeptidase n=1 Tax=Globodera rostochiensis TaxID=31243 RepID=A0A914I5H7_GLORO
MKHFLRRYRQNSLFIWLLLSRIDVVVKEMVKVPKINDGGDGKEQIKFCEPHKLTAHQRQYIGKRLHMLLKINMARHRHKIRTKRGTVGFEKKIWNRIPIKKDGKIFYMIPYTVLSPYDQKSAALLVEVMLSIHKSTCIRFVSEQEQTATSAEKKPRETCMKRRIVMHELLHILGLHHEHQRRQRSQYIDLNMDNVREGKERNFRVENDEQSWGLPYDYDSIMNYRSNQFAKNMDSLVIRVRNGTSICQTFFGSHRHASEMDFLLINVLYNCSGVHKMVDEFIKRNLRGIRRHHRNKKRQKLLKKLEKLLKGKEGGKRKEKEEEKKG